MQINPSHSFFLFLRATGFYLIKLIFPWPLNFAIDDVDPLYELAAMPLVGICLYIAAQRTMNSAIFTAGLFLFTPALLIALNQIAWTPYAERYLYSTTAFTAIVLVMYCHRRCVMLPIQWQYILATVVLLVFAGATFQRNTVWQKNITILADTAKKSPQDSTILWLYGAALLQEGKYQEALDYTQWAAKVPANPLSYNQIPEINIGHIQCLQGNIADAIATFETVVKRSSGKSPDAQEGLLKCYQYLWRSAVSKEEKENYFQSMITHAELLFALRPEPLIYYNLGKLALTDNDPEEARKLFTKAAANMKENHEYYPFVHKLLDNDKSE
jgi:tetratricopeptide (TPR) repeat protein